LLKIRGFPQIGCLTVSGFQIGKNIMKPSTLRKNKQRAVAFLVAAGASIGQAMAAVDAAVTTSLTDLATDVGTIAALAFGVTLIVVAYRYFRKSV
jgi:hypothetical protein